MGWRDATRPVIRDSPFPKKCNTAARLRPERSGLGWQRFCLKIGPGEAFLITIADRFRKPVHAGLGATNTALPQLNDAPTKGQQFLPYPGVA